LPLIEFCGFPGAGKSTIGRLLIERLRASGDTVVDRPAVDRELESRYVGATSLVTAVEALRYGARRPEWGRRMWRMVSRGRSRQTIRSLIRIQNQLRTSLALGATHQLVLDEWFVHQAWLVTLESRRVTVPAVQQLLRSIAFDLSGIPRLLIFLTAPPSVAALRVLRREEVTSFDRLSHTELAAVLTDARDALHALCATASENSTLLTFDTSVAVPSEIVEELMPRVRGLADWPAIDTTRETVR
jgi:shikimate kinase